jgi:hypothetical protein
VGAAQVLQLHAMLEEAKQAVVVREGGRFGAADVALLDELGALGKTVAQTLEVDRGGLARKLEFRRLTLAKVGREFAAKEARYRKLWQVRLAAQIADLPEFDAVYRNVKRTLRQAGIARR